MQYQHEHGETHRDRGLRQSLKRQRNQILRVMRERIRGSSLIIQTGRGPLVYGYSVLRLDGFVVAVLFGIRLAMGIMRSGRL
jgi:ubiquinone biosynthesis protein